MSRPAVIVAGRLVIKDDTGKGMGKAKRGITGALKDIAKSAAGFLARDVVNAMVRVGKESILMGAKAETLRRSFENLRDPIEDYDLTLENLRAAVQNTVSDIDLLTAANNAMALGLPRNELDDLFRAAQKVGAAMGRTTLEAVQDLTTGIGRQSKLILDNLGILVDTETAYDTFAATLGKTASELTTAERKTAFMTAAIDALNATSETLGDNLSDTQIAWEQLQAAMDNIKTEIGIKLIPVLGNLATDFSSFLSDLMDEIEEGDWAGAFEIIAKAFGSAFEGIQKWIGDMIDKIDWDKVFESLGNFVVTLPLTVARAFFNLGMEIGKVLKDIDWAEAFAATLSAFGSFIKGFFGAIFNILPKWLQDVILDIEGKFAGPTAPPPPLDPTIPGDIPGFQHGGIVTGPTVAKLGEAGPEAIIPLNQMGGLGGLQIHIHVGNFIGGDEAGARALGEMVGRAMLSQQERRGVQF